MRKNGAFIEKMLEKSCRKVSKSDVRTCVFKMLNLNTLPPPLCISSGALKVFLFPFAFPGSLGKFCWHGPDWGGVLPAGWSALDDPQQHGSGAGLREAPLQFQQVSGHWWKIQQNYQSSKTVNISRRDIYRWSKGLMFVCLEIQFLGCLDMS